MQITQHRNDEMLELRLAGRIDATWGDHLSATIQEAVRSGTHRVALNCSAVDYISSLGIGVIVTQYKLLQSVNGSLVVTNPSKFVREILTTVGLAGFLLEGATNVVPAAPAPAVRETRGGATYEVFPQPVSRPISCAFVGEPGKLARGFSEADCRTVEFPSGAFGLGLGAFGRGFEDCKSRFGEFLALGGCALALPTSGPDTAPDYVIQTGKLVPQLETLYAITGTGDFSSMVRFDSLGDGPGKIGLSELVTSLLDLSSAPAIAFAALVETACVIGTSLLKSPALGPLPHTVPSMRDWLSFTTERASKKSLALMIGLAGKNVPQTVEPFLRPLYTDSPIRAHIHAAVFNYQPVQRGELPFSGIVSIIIASSNPHALLHLMADARPYEGVGETDLARGACWMGAISDFKQG
jgi:anti-sigma B factor antagonist